MDTPPREFLLSKGRGTGTEETPIRFEADEHGQVDSDVRMGGQAWRTHATSDATRARVDASTDASNLLSFRRNAPNVRSSGAGRSSCRTAACAKRGRNWEEGGRRCKCDNHWAEMDNRHDPNAQRAIQRNTTHGWRRGRATCLPWDTGHGSLLGERDVPGARDEGEALRSTSRRKERRGAPPCFRRLRDLGHSDRWCGSPPFPPDRSSIRPRP